MGIIANREAGRKLAKRLVNNALTLRGESAGKGPAKCSSDATFTVRLASNRIPDLGRAQATRD